MPYRLWPADSDSIPTVRGQRLHRVDEVSVWGLHVWLWKENPAGLFADWNLTVSCPRARPTACGSSTGWHFGRIGRVRPPEETPIMSKPKPKPKPIRLPLPPKPKPPEPWEPAKLPERWEPAKLPKLGEIGIV